MRRARAGPGRGVPGAAASPQTAELDFVVPREPRAGPGPAKPCNVFTSIRRMRQAKEAYFEIALSGERIPLS